MRVAIGQFAAVDEPILRLASQLGASGVVVNTPDLGGPPWRTAELVALREQVEAHGLRLEAIENVPHEHYRDAILGLDGRDACVADYRQTVRALGAAGIDMLGLNWMAGGVGRTSFLQPGRGGALVTAF